MDCTTLVDENILEEHGESVNPLAAVILTTITAVLALCVVVPLGCLYGLKEYGESMEHGERPKKRGYSVLFGILSFFVASVLFMNYSYDLQELDQQDYQGKMRITGWEISRSVKTEGNSENTSYKSYFHALLQVDWGYEWACQDVTTVCNSTSSATPVCAFWACDDDSCSEEQDQQAREAATRCATQFYDYDATYIPYDALLGPSQDVDWPNIVLFGDCDSCAASGSVSGASNLRRRRNTGFVFLALSILSFAVFLVIKYKERSNRSDGEDKVGVLCQVCKETFASEASWYQHIAKSKGQAHKRYRDEHPGNWNITHNTAWGEDCSVEVEPASMNQDQETANVKTIEAHKAAWGGGFTVEAEAAPARMNQDQDAANVNAMEEYPLG